MQEKNAIIIQHVPRCSLTATETCRLALHSHFMFAYSNGMYRIYLTAVRSDSVSRCVDGNTRRTVIVPRCTCSHCFLSNTAWSGKLRVGWSHSGKTNKKTDRACGHAHWRPEQRTRISWCQALTSVNGSMKHHCVFSRAALTLLVSSRSVGGQRMFSTAHGVEPDIVLRGHFGP
jgi:hypothetical protein